MKKKLYCASNDKLYKYYGTTSVKSMPTTRPSRKLGYYWNKEKSKINNLL